MNNLTPSNLSNAIDLASVGEGACLRLFKVRTDFDEPIESKMATGNFIRENTGIRANISSLELPVQQKAVAELACVAVRFGKKMLIGDVLQFFSDHGIEPGIPTIMVDLNNQSERIDDNLPLVAPGFRWMEKVHGGYVVVLHNNGDRRELYFEHTELLYDEKYWFLGFKYPSQPKTPEIETQNENRAVAETMVRSAPIEYRPASEPLAPYPQKMEILMTSGELYNKARSDLLIGSTLIIIGLLSFYFFC